MLGMIVYFEFRMYFDESMYKRLSEPSGIVAIGFSYFFMGVMEPVEAGGAFMYNRKHNEEGHVTRL